MSLTKSPASNFGSGNSQSPRHRDHGSRGADRYRRRRRQRARHCRGGDTAAEYEIRSDARGRRRNRFAGRRNPRRPVQAAPPQTAPVARSQSVPPVEGPRTVWPDALSARANHNAETETPAPQQASPPANDRSRPEPERRRRARSICGRIAAPWPRAIRCRTRFHRMPRRRKNAWSRRRPANPPNGPSTKRQRPTRRWARRAARPGNRNRRWRGAARSPDSADQPGDGQAAAVLRRRGASSSFPARIKRQATTAAIGAAACSISSAKIIGRRSLEPGSREQRLARSPIGTTEHGVAAPPR